MTLILLKQMNLLGIRICKAISYTECHGSSTFNGVIDIVILMLGSPNLQNRSKTKTL